MSHQQEHTAHTFEHIVALTGIVMLAAVVIFMWYMIIYLPAQPQLPPPTGIPLPDTASTPNTGAIQ